MVERPRPDRRQAVSRGAFQFLIGAIALLCVLPAATAKPAQFTNPLLPSGPDPWIFRDGSNYYFMSTEGNRLVIRKTRDLGHLREATPVTVWVPPAHGPDAISIWAPELHRIGGKWFIYYTAARDGQDNDAHRGIFVLENDKDDPLTGTWIHHGRLQTAHPGIDGTVFEYLSRLYFVYSPYVGADSDLAIAAMTNPWTLAAPEVIIARPDLDWERQGGRQILEGPEFLLGSKGDLFLSYSASACWSDNYALGLLHAAPGRDPLDPAAWEKAPQPVFRKSAANSVYAPGHNGFFTSPDGRENWIVYHANAAAGLRCGTQRSPRMQRFTFDTSGRPDFGVPESTATPLMLPGAR